jgi:hypothetical protein
MFITQQDDIKNKKGQAQWFKSVILATWETEIGRITVQSQPGQKVHETLSQLTVGALWYAPVTPATQRSMNRRSEVLDGPGIK